MLGLTGSREEKGIVSVTIPYFTSSRDAVLTVGATTAFGLPEVGRNWTANEDGTFTVTVNYDGKPNEGGGDEDASGRADPVYQLQSSFEEEAIEAHPRINELIETYGGWWEGGRAVWPAKMPDKKGKGTGLGGGSSGSGASGSGASGETPQKENPMCGVEKYKKLSVQWQVSYAAKEIPGDVLANVGRIVGSPPGNPPSVDGRGKWLCMPPTAQKRGNVADVTENYFLMDNDVAPELYEQGGGSKE